MSSIHPDPGDIERQDYVTTVDAALSESLAELAAHPDAPDVEPCPGCSCCALGQCTPSEHAPADCAGWVGEPGPCPCASDPDDPGARKLTAAYTLTRLLTLDAPACCSWTIDNTATIHGQLAHTFGDDLDEIRRQLHRWAAVLFFPEFTVTPYTAAAPAGKVAVTGRHLGNVRVEIWDGYPDVTGLTVEDISAPVEDADTAPPSAEVSSTTVSERLGHKGAAITSDAYQHLAPEVPSTAAALAAPGISFDITGGALQNLLNRVLPHVDPITSGEDWAAVHIEVSPDAITLSATDRYTMAVATHQIAHLLDGQQSPPFRVAIPGPPLDALVPALVDNGGSDCGCDDPQCGWNDRYNVTLDPDGLSITSPDGWHVTIERSDTVPLEWRQVLHGHLNADVTPTPEGLIFNAEQLARFAAVEGDPLIMRPHGPVKALIVTAGADFIGAIMPGTLREIHEQGAEALTHWRGLCAPAPATERTRS